MIFELDLRLELQTREKSINKSISTFERFLDAFWEDLELLLGGVGAHLSSLFGATFVVCFWSGFGPGFGTILVPFWITCGTLLGPFAGRLKECA